MAATAVAVTSTVNWSKCNNDNWAIVQYQHEHQHHHQHLHEQQHQHQQISRTCSSSMTSFRTSTKSREPSPSLLWDLSLGMDGMSSRRVRLRAEALHGAAPAPRCHAGVVLGSVGEVLRKPSGIFGEVLERPAGSFGYESGTRVVREWCECGTRVVREWYESGTRARARAAPCLAMPSRIKHVEVS